MDYDIINNATILIVDDQPSNLSILFDYLNKFNAKVLLAQNGPKAIELALKKKPAIILLDIIMPDMDGYEVCNRLKEDEKTKDIPVIFMSALTETGNIVKGFEAGAVDYIVKPVQQQEVLARITTHLKLRYMEEQMRQIEKFESLGIMAGGIAHNFNNILTGVLGYAELALIHIQDDSPARLRINQIIEAARKAADITKKILAFSGGNRLVMSIDNIDLSELVLEMKNLLELSITNDCDVKYELAYNLSGFSGDSSQIGQAVINLIINSSEAIGNNEGTIIVRTGEVDSIEAEISEKPLNGYPQGPFNYIEIEDDGCGISPDIRDRIFDPFFSTKFIGRGLGLAAVHGIVKNHNGIIDVKSEAEKGTKITIYFPSPSLKR